MRAGRLHPLAEAHRAANNASANIAERRFSKSHLATPTQTGEAHSVRSNNDTEDQVTSSVRVPGSPCDGGALDPASFGNRLPNVDYRERPGTYAVIINNQERVAVMRTPVGLYLPGGGADPGETEEETLAREVLEECGRRVAVARPLCRATQYLHATGEGHFAKRCSFFVVELGDTAVTDSEADHEWVWMPIEDALLRLSSESQRWALAQAISSQARPKPRSVPPPETAPRRRAG